MPGRRRHQPVLVVRVDAVEAQQDVEVDRAPALHLSHLAVRDPDRRDGPHPAGVNDHPHWRDAAPPAHRSEVAFDRLLGASPQLPGEVVPDDLVVVVVAVQAQRLPQMRIVWVVSGEARHGLPVHAGRRGSAGVAGCRAAVAASPAGAGVSWDVPVVHRPE